MKDLALGVLDDLRARKLWPVALFLVVALIAVPVVMLKPAEPVPAPVPSAGTASTATVGGLPSPEEALANGGKPLVSLAVLNAPSDLESFESKNPFQPLEELSGLPADDQLAFGDTGAGAGISSGTTTDTSGGTGGGSFDTGGGGTGGGGGFDPGGALPLKPIEPDPPVSPTPPKDPSEPPAEPEAFTFAVDLTFDGPGGPERRYRNVQRLEMLPSEASPLLVFLGVSAGANSAVFLVDSTLQAINGEGVCSPSPTECATLSLEPGEQQTFIDDQDRKYFVRIDQIREVSVERAQRQSAARAGTAVGRKPVRRFVLPIFTDLLMKAGQ